MARLYKALAYLTNAFVLREVTVSLLHVTSLANVFGVGSTTSLNRFVFGYVFTAEGCDIRLDVSKIKSNRRRSDQCAQESICPAVLSQC